MDINVLIFISIILVCGITAGGYIYKVKKGGSKTTLELIIEYSRLITILATETVEILSIKDISDDAFKMKLADMVGDRFYNEIQEDDYFKDSLLGRITKEEIKCTILRLFEMDLDDFNISNIIKEKKKQLMEKECTFDDTDEEIKTTDISKEL